MRTRLLATAGLTATLALPSLLGPLGAGAAPTAPRPRASDAVEAAVAWLETQQQADGGFDGAGFPGFETPDVVLALAAAGQSGPGWSEAEALAAVQAVATPGGLDALDALDDLVDTPTSPTQAAKVIALDVVPLGLDTGDFDPSGDSAAPVDLLALVRSGAGDGSYPNLAFNGQVYVAWALATLGEPVPAPLLALIDGAQQANGSFDYSGLPGGSDIDPDLTASVIMALTLAGRPATDPTVRGAVLALGRAQGWNGEWASPFDDGNPNSTAQAMLAAVTLGSDPETPCWRDRADGRFTGVRYRSPSVSLLRRQAGDGSVASPSDGPSRNTFGTAQTVQALVAAEGPWPYAGAGCSTASPGDSRRLVNAHYVDLLGRFSDQAGAQFWVGLLDAGIDPARVSQRLTGTPEYGRRVVDEMYRAYLDRPASPAERAAGAPGVLAGRRLDRAAAILGSQEYYEGAVEDPTPPSAAAWVSALYRDVLGRTGDDGALAWLRGQLEAGRSRAAVARTLLRTDEALGVMVDGFYRDLLRRRSDPSGRAFWVRLFQRGRSPEALVLLIAGSAEYVAATRAPA
ncbi:MAG TPA: DUF4214 domain-containing protein [Acidimicrobiales bacterium]|nr:DUF4214 domain-containing protein [Acidimicrobiales bacterium]